MSIGLHYFNNYRIMRNLRSIRGNLTRFNDHTNLPDDLLAFESLCFVSFQTKTYNIYELHAFERLDMCFPIMVNPFSGASFAYASENAANFRFGDDVSTVYVPETLLTNSSVENFFIMAEYYNDEKKKRVS